MTDYAAIVAGEPVCPHPGRRKRNPRCAACYRAERLAHLKNSHQANHARLRKARGAAAAHLCVDCGKQAEEWSQRHNTDGTLPSHYDPRCKKCHRNYDRASYITTNGNALLTHCKNGHEFTEENTYRRANKRICKECRKLYKRAWRQR